MRILVILPLALAAACTPRTDSGSNATAASDNQVAAATSTSAPSEPTMQPDGMLSGASRTSELARSAVAVVDRYFLLIGEKKYREARLLWDDKGAASGGDDKAFAATFAPYSVYRPKVGEPTEVKSTNGVHYVLVTADLHVKLRYTGREQDRSGSVMLRRSADPKEKAAGKRDWHIWGMDIRQRD